MTNIQRIGKFHIKKNPDGFVLKKFFEMSQNCNPIPRW